MCVGWASRPRVNADQALRNAPSRQRTPAATTAACHATTEALPPRAGLRSGSRSPSPCGGCRGRPPPTRAVPPGRRRASAEPSSFFYGPKLTDNNVKWRYLDETERHPRKRKTPYGDMMIISSTRAERLHLAQNDQNSNAPQELEQATSSSTRPNVVSPQIDMSGKKREQNKKIIFSKKHCLEGEQEKNAPSEGPGKSESFR